MEESKQGPGSKAVEEIDGIQFLFLVMVDSISSFNYNNQVDRKGNPLSNENTSLLTMDNCMPAKHTT